MIVVRFARSQIDETLAMRPPFRTTPTDPMYHGRKKLTQKCRGMRWWLPRARGAQWQCLPEISSTTLVPLAFYPYHIAEGLLIPSRWCNDRCDLVKGLAKEGIIWPVYFIVWSSCFWSHWGSVSLLTRRSITPRWFKSTQNVLCRLR